VTFYHHFIDNTTVAISSAGRAMPEEAPRSRFLLVGATGRLARATPPSGSSARTTSPLLEPLIAVGATLLQVNARCPYYVPCATAQVNALYLCTVLRD
jgi:hypothetical protein